VVYAASANGGAFRSDDAGVSWTALMDAFDVQPENFASTCMACGAVAIDRNDPRRVYVGTGEGDTYAIFDRRLANALPTYRGVGPLRSDDSGEQWLVEPTAAGSPSLAGAAFFALAVDPVNRENVVAGTTAGLYQRVPTEGGQAEWAQRRADVYCSVVVAAANGTTRFFAAQWGTGVFYSPDGHQWLDLSAGFPTDRVGRIALGAQPNNPDQVYALVADGVSGGLLGIYRLDGIGGSWTAIDNPPDLLPLDEESHSQGDYDLAVAMDPVDPNLIYLGGSLFNDPRYWPGSIWRCRVEAGDAGFRFTATDSIGTRAHADIHVLVHTPDDPTALWTGCDGGVFLNRDPRNSDNFASRNNGLACLCTNYFAQHPTDPGILLCGLQDNGTARTSGGPIWAHINGGDGGYCLINWADPQKVLVYANGRVYRATDGGQGEGSWVEKKFPWALMTEPIVGTPYNPDQPADADLVALGSARIVGQALQRVVYLSTDFGDTWPAVAPIDTQGGIYSLAFASKDLFHVGTTAGEVFRVDRVDNTWQVTRVDNVATGPLGLVGPVSDIAIDWADASRSQSTSPSAASARPVRGITATSGTSTARAGRRVAVPPVAGICWMWSTTPSSWTARRRRTSTSAPTWAFGTPRTTARPGEYSPTACPTPRSSICRSTRPVACCGLPHTAGDCTSIS
jgi:hypothetical protein